MSGAIPAFIWLIAIEHDSGFLFMVSGAVVWESIKMWVKLYWENLDGELF